MTSVYIRCTGFIVFLEWGAGTMYCKNNGSGLCCIILYNGMMGYV